MAKWDLSKLALQEISDIGQEMESQREREEAIVRAALEKAQNAIRQDARNGDLSDGAAQWAIDTIRSLASDHAEVAAIISAAAQLNKERSDEEDRWMSDYWEDDCPADIAEEIHKWLKEKSDEKGEGYGG